MEKVKILDDFFIVNKALWLEKPRILIIADSHIGYEEALVKEGIFVPKTTFNEIKKEILDLLKLKPETIV